jgi:type IV pilus assembly protein PilP
MMLMKHTRILQKACLALLFTGIFVYVDTASAWASAAENPTPSTLAILDELEGKSTAAFEYQLEGRPDPFTPFITDKAASQKLGNDEIIEEDFELTGMRKFEPGQLTLVAILSSGNRRIAMVEDVTGRGYILNEGMPIGRRGVVSRIDNEQVTVLEVAHTRAGRKLESQIVMRLNKEGEK